MRAVRRPRSRPGAPSLRARLAAVLGALVVPLLPGAVTAAAPLARFVAPEIPGGAPPHLLYPLPAGPVEPGGCPPPAPVVAPAPEPTPLPAPGVPEAAVPLATAPGPRDVVLSALSGKGIWLTLFPGDTLDAPALIATAHRAGLHQLWVRTGSSHDGFYGGALLRALVPAAHAAGLAVVAWDFPTLSDPAADAERARAAFAAGADAFGADIESSAEGTYLTARRVAYYLSLVRAAAGDRPVVGIVPAPSAHWLSIYPYSVEAPYVDAFAPMVYWSCTEPGLAVRRAMALLAHLRPVAPVGQDYDMASEGGRVGLPSGREIWRFLDVAHRTGAIGASLYDLESGGRLQLRALSDYPW